jgi:hypothetical protein
LEFQIDEGGGELGAGLRKGIASSHLSGEAVEGAAKGTVPRPLFHLAEGVEVGPAALAAGEEISFGTIDGTGARFVHGSEGSD